MPEYAFFFGYETPRQLKNNDAHGWDDDDSLTIVIEARSEQQAFEWGRRLADSFCSQLHGDRFSWTQSGYAHCIRYDFTREQLANLEIKRVQVGEFPDFSQTLARIHDQDS